MGLWPNRTEVSMTPARLSVTTSLLPDAYDWLHDEAHRVGVSMSRIVADIISDYRVSLASADAHSEIMKKIMTDQDELDAFNARTAAIEETDDPTKR